MIFQKKINLIFALLLSLVLVFPACKTRKGVLGGKSASQNTLKLCKKNNLQYNKLKLTGKAKAIIPAMDLDMGFGYRIHLLKDSLVWIRVSKFGLEGMRVLITRDSVFILNRQDKSFHRAGLSYIQDFTGAEPDIAIVQALITGDFQPVKALSLLEFLKGKSDAETIVFGTEVGEITLEYGLDPKLKKLKQIHAGPAKINYAEFSEVVSGKLCPLSTEIVVQNLSLEVLGQNSLPASGNIILTHSKFQFDPEKLSFKFTIPANYVRVTH